jgi:hypothetical protein
MTWGAAGLDDSARCRKKRRATYLANSGKSCSNSGIIVDSSLSACDTVSLGRRYSTFRSTAVPQVSGSSSLRTVTLDPEDTGTKLLHNVGQ